MGKSEGEKLKPCEDCAYCYSLHDDTIYKCMNENSQFYNQMVNEQDTCKEFTK